MAIHKDDLPISLTNVEKFKMYGIDFQIVYERPPVYESEEYLKFASVMQNFDLINEVRSFNYNWRKKNSMLSEEELSNIEKFKEYYASL